MNSKPDELPEGWNQKPRPAFIQYSELDLRRQRVRNLAVGFERVAYGGVGLLTLFFLFYFANDGFSTGALLIWLGSCVGIYSWFMLIAQVIHIRANSEK